jgi:hypothetical protein
MSSASNVLLLGRPKKKKYTYEPSKLKYSSFYFLHLKSQGNSAPTNARTIHATAETMNENNQASKFSGQLQEVVGRPKATSAQCTLLLT